MLPSVLNSGSGIAIAGEACLCHRQQHFSGLQVVNWRSLSVADGRGVYTTQQTGLLTTTILTPFAPVVIQLPVVVLPGGDIILISGTKPLREKLDKEVPSKSPRRKPSDVLSLGHRFTGGAALCRRNAAGAVSLRRLSVSLAEVQDEYQL